MGRDRPEQGESSVESAESAVTFQDAHPVVASSAFLSRPPPESIEVTIDAETRKDPVLDGHTVFVAPPVPSSADLSDRQGIFKEALAAEVEDVAARRQERNLRPISDPQIENMNLMASHALGEGEQAFTSGKVIDYMDHGPDVPDIRMVIMDTEVMSVRASRPFSPDINAGENFEGNAPNGYTHLAGVHELVHVAMGLSGDAKALSIHQEEGIADATAILTLAARAYPDDPEQAAQEAAAAMEEMADWRGLSLENTDHAPAADGLLKVRHAILTDPEMRKKLLSPETVVSDRVKKVEGIVVGSVSRDISAENTAEKNIGLSPETEVAALDYAREILGGRTTQIPKNIDRDFAVTLLRTQIDLEENGAKGADNTLSKMMPHIWEKNPEAFAQAQDYMKEQYGIEVISPLRQMEGMQAGAAAHEAAAKAGPARSKPLPGPKM